MNNEKLRKLALLLLFCLLCYIHPHYAHAEQNTVIPSKTIYLTFDDGPSDRVTPLILDILKKEDVKATFFIIGKQAETRQAIVKRAFQEGHTIAIHSYTHDYHTIYASPSALKTDIEKCNSVITKITGASSNIYRFPGGSYGLNQNLISTVINMGMRYVDWNACNQDAELWQPSAWQLYQSAIKTAADRSHVVLLCHDSTTKLTTAQSLPDIIHYYKEHGYVFEKFTN